MKNSMLPIYANHTEMVWKKSINATLTEKCIIQADYKTLVPFFVKMLNTEIGEAIQDFKIFKVSGLNISQKTVITSETINIPLQHSLQEDYFTLIIGEEYSTWRFNGNKLDEFLTNGVYYLQFTDEDDQHTLINTYTSDLFSIVFDVDTFNSGDPDQQYFTNFVDEGGGEATITFDVPNDYSFTQLYINNEKLSDVIRCISKDDVTFTFKIDVTKNATYKFINYIPNVYEFTSKNFDYVYTPS